MAINIIELVKDQIDDGFLDTAASVTGLDATRARSAVGGAIPAVLAGLVSATSKPSGRNALAAALQDQDPELLDKLSSMRSGESRQSLIGSGLQSMTSLLGEGQLGRLASSLGGFAGIGQTGAKSLVGLVAPAVLGVIGREQKTRGLDINGVTDLLGQQRGNIASALPAGLASALGPTGLLDDSGQTARSTARAGAASARTAARPMRASAAPPDRRRNWPIFVIAGLAALAVLAWALTRAPDRDRAVEPGPATAERGVDADRGQAAVPRAGTASLMVGNVDVGQELTEITDGMSTTMRGVTDEASAEAALPMLSALGEQLDGLMPLVDRLPEHAKPAFTAMARDKATALRGEVDRISSMSGIPESVKSVVAMLHAKLDSLVA
ncbi:MAG TPA: DUF937 domain-containing protein [Gammaproteobacteria bacterium]